MTRSAARARLLTEVTTTMTRATRAGQGEQHARGVEDSSTKVAMTPRAVPAL